MRGELIAGGRIKSFHRFGKAVTIRLSGMRGRSDLLWSHTLCGKVFPVGLTTSSAPVAQCTLDPTSATGDDQRQIAQVRKGLIRETRWVGSSCRRRSGMDPKTRKAKACLASKNQE